MAAAQVPPGVNLNADRSEILIRATMVCAVLAGLAVAGRITSRRMMKARITLSDGLVILSMFCSWVICGLGVWLAKLGLGKHIYIVPPDHLTTMLQIVFADQILYSIVMTTVKVSILLLYHGLFPGRTFTRLLIAVGVFCIGWGLSCFFVAIFSCTPVHGFWNKLMTPPPQCINNQAYYIGLSAPHILADIAILCMPVTKVWKLQMTRRFKIAVSGMFLLGGIVVICSIIRFAFLMTVDNVDFTWSYYTIVVWSAAEAALAVVSACIPTMRPVLVFLLALLPFSRFQSGRSSARKVKSYKSDQTSWNNLSDTPSKGDEFERLHAAPFDARHKPLPAVYEGPGRGSGITDIEGATHELKDMPRGVQGKESLQQIHVKKDIWVQ